MTNRLKCSRSSPCDACVRTGDASTCSYVSQNNLQKDHLASENSRKDALTARIDKLEALLLAAMQTAQTPQSNTTNDTSGAGSSDGNSAFIHQSNSDSTVHDTERMIEKLGIMKVDPDHGRTAYLGGAHWVSIMCEVCLPVRWLVSPQADMD
jgi:hypothetical protein